jgi:hypothetical protein
MSQWNQPTPLPPTKILKDEHISQSAAHEFLTAYLERAATDPSLQPDSTLSTHGPVSANTGATQNLVIHNLKRVQAGLAGEILGRDLTFANQAGTFELQSHQFTDGQDWSGTGGKANAAVNDEWQDLQSYEREQVDLVQAGDEDGAEDVAVQTPAEQMDVDDEGMPRVGKIDKEERKRAKKERKKAEQRARAAGGS